MTEAPQHYPTCSACGAESLEPGFLDDSSDAGYARWIPGALERGVFGTAKKFRKERWIVEAWRCGKCQHLELFARELKRRK